MPKFNFTEADESTGFEPLPRGDYPFEVAEIDDERETSEDAKKFPNAPMTSITFSCLDPAYENRQVWLNLVFPEDGSDDAAKQIARSVGRVKQLCRATGNWTEEELEAPDFELDWDDLLGAQVTLRLVAQKGGGGNNIQRIAPLDDTDSDELP